MAIMQEGNLLRGEIILEELHFAGFDPLCIASHREFGRTHNTETLAMAVADRKRYFPGRTVPESFRRTVLGRPYFKGETGSWRD